MIFRRKGKTFLHEKLYYGNEELENVDSFSYLGTVFSYTGNFEHNNEQIVGKALKALNVFLMN